MSYLKSAIVSRYLHVSRQCNSRRVGSKLIQIVLKEWKLCFFFTIMEL